MKKRNKILIITAALFLFFCSMLGNWIWIIINLIYHFMKKETIYAALVILFCIAAGVFIWMHPGTHM